MELLKTWRNIFNSGPAAPSSGKFKFTFEELRNLYDVLVKNPVVTEANRAVVVETIRSIAEFMIWGDQHEPKIFDFFLENNVMLYLQRVMQQPSNRSGDVAKQVLQTLSIIIQNVKSETGTFFLFSNNQVGVGGDTRIDFFWPGQVCIFSERDRVAALYVCTPTVAHPHPPIFRPHHAAWPGLQQHRAGMPRFTLLYATHPHPPRTQVNNIVEVRFDFEDEEVLGYYISFLKTISLKLNPSTVQLFFDRSREGQVLFPLYSEAVKFAHHKEGMVRAGVRTLTLNVYAVDEPTIHSYVSSPPATTYFVDMCGYIAEQIRVRTGGGGGGGGPDRGPSKTRAHLCWCNVCSMQYVTHSGQVRGRGGGIHARMGGLWHSCQEGGCTRHHASWVRRMRAHAHHQQPAATITCACLAAPPPCM